MTQQDVQADSRDNEVGQTNSFLVEQLRNQVEELRKTLTFRSRELDQTRQDLDQTRDCLRKADIRVSELISFLDRSKQLSGSDGQVNLEYLKNCVFKFICSFEGKSASSEQRALYPVIATILRLSTSK